MAKMTELQLEVDLQRAIGKVPDVLGLTLYHRPQLHLRLSSSNSVSSPSVVRFYTRSPERTAWTLRILVAIPSHGPENTIQLLDGWILAWDVSSNTGCMCQWWVVLGDGCRQDKLADLRDTASQD